MPGKLRGRIFTTGPTSVSPPLLDRSGIWLMSRVELIIPAKHLGPSLPMKLRRKWGWPGMNATIQCHQIGTESKPLAAHIGAAFIWWKHHPFHTGDCVRPAHSTIETTRMFVVWEKTHFGFSSFYSHIRMCASVFSLQFEFFFLLSFLSFLLCERQN